MTPIFKTNKKAGERSEQLIKRFNELPAFVVTGGEIVFVSDDFLEVHLKFNLTENTKNYHGTGFGGAIYSSLDPIYPLQLCNILGDGYVVWDLSANIDYLKPITKHVYARFLLSQQTITKIKQDVITKNKSVISLPVCYEDTDNNIYAKANKTIYIADREYFNNKKK
ncbi:MULTISPECIES: PaaI family thioesterase [Francisella]|uniref:DUF4442 domain-containing protein n=1 Tax=Francisella opportunistica TaxID=2016517 RepID=A0A345JTQ6_9GAMM|nr:MULTISPECIES: DUF4442 domain-containing protein [Francisella]APC91577.1 hypothetical protein BBG19_0841 [Francisella sp. MA067296]AXH30702.1 DUF4442 domain-containing protein [Francisella opportunistica]AXH32346.1 DUF4442 domain-containing protein [Francisella opportunistica]AXH33992.1 DUF4442 domain-containing protein [Francisella opportunistica]